MNRGAELGQYFCANTELKTFNRGWTPLTLFGYASALIPKWLWCKRNSVLNLTSRVPVNYNYTWHVSSVSTALSSNIPTGLLVDCCWDSSAVFQLFVFFGGFNSLNLAGIQQSSRIFIGRGKGQPPQQGGGWYHNGDAHGPCRRAAGRWVRGRGRANPFFP